MCITLWKEVEKQFSVSLKSVVTGNACIKPKRITWRKKIETYFHGADISFNNGFEASNILKIGNVYKQGRQYCFW